jgi:hypothetical protein
MEKRMCLHNIDYFSKCKLDKIDPTQNHYKYKDIRESDRGRKYLIITDTESGDDSWKIYLTEKLALQIATINRGEWFYIIYNPPASAVGRLKPNHLLIKQTLIDRKDIFFEDTDCEVDLDDLEKEYVFPTFPS